MNKCPQCEGSLNDDKIASGLCSCGYKFDSEELSVSNNKFGAGTIIWFSLCAISHLWGAYKYFSIGVNLSTIICLMISCCYVLLITSRTKFVFYPIALIAITTSILIFYIYRQLFLAFSPLLNPIITYLVLLSQGDKVIEFKGRGT